VQAIFNDVAKAENRPRPLDESGAFGPKTQKHVSEFQQKHGISPASGIVGPKTWKALLESWTKLRPLPLDD
jgi:peptidoglycan hydrolase-like protein with peptidoglycan-binding domain